MRRIATTRPRAMEVDAPYLSRRDSASAAPIATPTAAIAVWDRSSPLPASLRRPTTARASRGPWALAPTGGACPAPPSADDPSSGDVATIARAKTCRRLRWDNGRMTKSELIERIARTQSHSRRARRRIGGEHDARAHGGVPCRRRPDRDPRARELLGALAPCTRRPQSQDRNAGIASGETYSLLQAGKASARTSESDGRTMNRR